MNLLPTEGGEGGEGGGEGEKGGRGEGKGRRGGGGRGRGERVKKGEIEWALSLAKAPALNVKHLNNRPGHSIE